MGPLGSTYKQDFHKSSFDLFWSGTSGVVRCLDKDVFLLKKWFYIVNHGPDGDK